MFLAGPQPADRNVLYDRSGSVCPPARSKPQLFCIVVACWSLASGCFSHEDRLQELIEACAELPGATTSPNADLREELTRLEEDRGTPRQMRRLLPADEENLAAALAMIFRGEESQQLFERTAELFPRQQFAFRPIDQRQVSRFVDAHRTILAELDLALSREACNFAIPFERGYFFDLVFIDEVIAASRLLGLRSSVALDARDVNNAAADAASMLGLAGNLARESHLESRVAAASIRREALLVIEAIAHHAHVNRSALRTLYERLGQQLQAWPTDADALAGDRALTLHSYEIVRMGHLKMLLTEEEKERYRSEGILSDLLAVAADHVDQDELFYLRSMRKLIDLCQVPYYERTTNYAELIRANWESQDEPRHSLLATHLFLPDLIPSLRLLAQDRARTMAWWLALAHAIGRPPSETLVNPHTGRPLDVVENENSVAVLLGEVDERDPVVPLPSD